MNEPKPGDMVNALPADNYNPRAHDQDLNYAMLRAEAAEAERDALAAENVVLREAAQTLLNCDDVSQHYEAGRNCETCNAVAVMNAVLSNPSKHASKLLAVVEAAKKINPTETIGETALSGPGFSCHDIDHTLGLCSCADKAAVIRSRDDG
jgi:hypothetical protein